MHRIHPPDKSSSTIEFPINIIKQYQQWWRREHLSLVWIMVPVCHVRMGSARVQVSVWTASGIGHWKRLIKITGDTDCSYYINNMTYPIHVYYCSVVLFTILDILCSIMSHVYLVIFHDTCYTSCGDTLFMYTYTLHSMYSVSGIRVDTVTI